MIIYSLFFYGFACFLLTSAIMVISSKNPVHSVLWLIFAFFNAAGLFLLTGAEFISMTLIIVYVGAVAVLFLFVVMMLNINQTKFKESFRKNIFLCSLIALVLFADLLVIYFKSIAKSVETKTLVAFSGFNNISNTHMFGMVLYTNYMPIFIISGLILLVAMIGAITLNHRKRHHVKKQNVIKQLNRKVSDSMELVKVEIGRGVE